MIPGVEYYQRDNHQMKKVIEDAKERGFTDLMLFYEKMGKPRKWTLEFEMMGLV